MSDIQHPGPGAHGEARDPDRGRIGMWLFISTEVLLFGGLFLLYSVYRYRHSGDFHEGSAELSRLAGTFNTIVLITSSLTAVLSGHALHLGQRRLARAFILATLGLGLTFLVVKGFEWAGKFEHGLYPGAAHLLSLPPGSILFFGLYFTMTGLHAIHVIVGMSIFGYCLWRLRDQGQAGSTLLLLENTGLFWHLVDVIWIFLFPLFYLIA